MAQADVLVIGSGIAGLSVAIKVAQRFPGRQCLVITKQESAESNTRYAQGGIAVVSDFKRDSFEDHIQDTLEAGDGLCDPAVVDHVVHQAPARLQELIEMGADFDRNAAGELVLGREGGHKANRIIHHQDVTGLNISTALLEKVKSLPNISVLSHHVAVDLITTEQITASGNTVSRCHGAKVLNLQTNTLEEYLSAVTVLATGGIGQLYQTTTNPLIATGDGIAMAFRAGAKISNMEFVQFHPTAFYDLHGTPAFLISEAVRGEGAYLRNSAGERFMFRYHINGELACRDVVSRAIACEILHNDEPFVYVDCTHVDQGVLLRHFPNIYKTCLAKGIDITTDYIPVTPAAHYLCGGVDVDLRSRTTVENLYACGECSNTGLHGANRLASNSLLEATVFAHNCFLDMTDSFNGRHVSLHQHHVSLHEMDAEVPTVRKETDPQLLLKKKAKLQSVMSKYAGIVRSEEGLRYAYRELNVLEVDFSGAHENIVHSAQWYELRNMIICAKLIVEKSMDRKQNKGGFFNEDLAMDQVAG
jgi:L-aspartate oxidase